MWLGSDMRCLMIALEGASISMRENFMFVVAYGRTVL